MGLFRLAAAALAAKKRKILINLIKLLEYLISHAHPIPDDEGG